MATWMAWPTNIKTIKQVMNNELHALGLQSYLGFDAGTRRPRTFVLGAPTGFFGDDDSRERPSRPAKRRCVPCPRSAVYAEQGQADKGWNLPKGLLRGNRCRG